MSAYRTCLQQGFTLIEVMIVMVILGIMATLIVPNIIGRPDEARVTVAKSDIMAISNALELYKIDNYTYPSTAQGLEALVSKPSGNPDAPNWKGSYLKELPVDPWGMPYQYLCPGTHGAYDVYSLGADKQPGGEGYNADIGNWKESAR